MAMSDSTGWLAAPPPLPSLRRGPEPARIGNVLVGTASWTEKTLVASRAFYPAGVTTAEQRLRYYTRHFPVVEVDATYYALPSLENARRSVIHPDCRNSTATWKPASRSATCSR